MNEVQVLVDALAVELGRPIAVDDHRFSVLAYSSHVDEFDPVRLASILARKAPEEVAAWLTSLRIHDADSYLRVPANPAFGMVARICLPIRFRDTLLGYLWLLDEPSPVPPSDVDTSIRCAAEVGVALYRRRLLERSDRELESELVQRLVGDEAGAQELAAAELVRDNFLARATFYTAVALQPLNPDGLPMPDVIRVLLAAAVARFRRSLAPRHLLILVTGEQVVAIVAHGEEGEADRRANALLLIAQENLMDCPGWSAVIGVGGARRSPAQLHESHIEAQHAVRLGGTVPSLGPVVRWSSLGAYRTLASVVGTRDVSRIVPACVRRLLASDDGAKLVMTLETYLERGGDARATVDALYIHRSSLYQRLHRIEDIAGIDLRSGDARLELQLGLRLWRMSGSFQDVLPPDAYG